MSELMWALIAVAVAFLVLVPPVLFLLGRFDVVGVPLAILGAAIATATATLLAAVTRTPTVPWLIATAPVLYTAAAGRAFLVGAPSKTDSGSDGRSLIGALVVAASSVVILARAPVKWDARSIWFFHSSWFADSATVYIDVASMYFFGHGDYPPYAASFGAYAWLFGSNRNDWIPQLATGVLVLAACALLSVLIVRRTAPRLVSVAMGGVAMIAALGVIESRGLDGYMDGLLAALIAVLALSAFRNWDAQVVTIAAIAAALTKNEGLLFVVVVIVPAYALTRRRVWLLGPGIALGAAWALNVRLAWPNPEGWIVRNVLPWSEVYFERLSTIAVDLISYPTLQAAGLVWFGALVAARALRTGRQTLGLLIGMGAIAGALLVVTIITYLVTPHDLAWHLETSASRLIMHPSMVLLAGGLAAALDIVSAVIQDKSRSQHQTPQSVA